MKLWNFNKLHAKGWSIGKTHGLEIQLDYWKNSPLIDMSLQRRGPEQDHAGIRFAINLFHWEFHIDYYSVFHADHTTVAHQHSSQHRDEIVASEKCGCFYCMASFPPAAIVEWVDKEQTALCPQCGIDAVIGDKSGFPVTIGYLKQMNKRWF